MRNMQTLLDYYERQRKGRFITNKNILTLNHKLMSNDWPAGSILCKLQNMKFRPVCKDNYQTRLQHFLMHDLDKFMSALNDVQINDSTNTKDTEATPRVDLKDMPVKSKSKTKTFFLINR